MKTIFFIFIALILCGFFSLATSQPVSTSYVFTGGVHEGDCTIWRLLTGSFRMVPQACPSPVLVGTSVTMGGSMIVNGNCVSNNTSVPGATMAMVAVASPVTYPGDKVLWKTYVSATNTVTVKLCAFATVTPITSVYNVRVIQ